MSLKVRFLLFLAQRRCTYIVQLRWTRQNTLSLFLSNQCRAQRMCWRYKNIFHIDVLAKRRETCSGISGVGVIRGNYKSYQIWKSYHLVTYCISMPTPTMKVFGILTLASVVTVSSSQITSQIGLVTTQLSNLDQCTKSAPDWRRPGTVPEIHLVFISLS